MVGFSSHLVDAAVGITGKTCEICLMKFIVLCVIILFGFSMAATDANSLSREVSFWQWFERNEKELWNFTPNQKAILGELSAELKKVDPNLTFEFGPKAEFGFREFFISAGGMIDTFPAVERLFAQAPKLDNWKFVKFLPPRPIMSLQVGDLKISLDSVKFQLFEDGKKIGIMLFFDDYDEKRTKLFTMAGFLMLDNALGEYVVATKVGFVKFSGKESKFYDKSQKLVNLKKSFQDAMEN